ncbi:DUF2975 domain-containing protein [Thorsellia kenyensis]|uniref:DUF2975 domain-containing protein n=1 Tax=Thorsellia kenyensis TaxID=1549888 RepID=A0ABV6CA33_9GAMM
MATHSFWTQKHSIKLTQWVIKFTSIAILFIFSSAPFSESLLAEKISSDVHVIFSFILMTLYSGGILGLLLMYFLLKLLKNILNNQVFIGDNIHYLRVISWICFLGGLIGLISTFYWILWLPVSFMAIFIGLIIRVIKNILAAAITIKEENDYTI